MITPILKDPKTHGGTLYTFPSASRDLTRAFSNSEYEFAFSHFACLNLPDFRYGKFTDGDSESPGDLKGIYLDNLYPECISLSNHKLNTALKWHLQSYVMNYEVGILNGCSLDLGEYNNEILRNPSERIFFNWLQKVGAIKFENYTETLDGYGVDVDVEYETLNSEDELPSMGDSICYRIDNKLYTWKGGEWRSRVLVSKTVQYIGTIDMVNNVNIDYDSFNEIYLNIPAGVGGSTSVLFFNTFDENYEEGEIIDIDNDIYCTNEKYIIGRDPEESGSDDITLTAIYDNSSLFEYDSDKVHSYKIDTGYCIDFNDDSYYGEGGGIEAMNMYSEEDFEFNCILIYYRIRKGDGPWYTNLYGVLFLEDVKDVTISDYDVTKNDNNERGGYIQRYPKFKRGNSWGLKLDLKIDAQPDSQLELRDKEYDDPNNGGVGMQMFTEALMQLNECTKLFYDVKKENVDIENRLHSLENVMYSVDNVYDLSLEVNLLRSKVDVIGNDVNSSNSEIEEIKERLTTLENNFGYLIRNIDDIVNIRVSNLETNLNDLKKTIEQYKLIIEDVE